ncbi:MAG: hypothetical protein IPO32_09220 [Crocinitomicaceae bacterium]|nr:hypothetical protein [Crocinitomicaceae bacterium]
MKKVKILLWIIPISILTLSSCKKKVWGCMDETALNYSPVATEDAQDCVYDEVIASTVLNNTWSLDGTTWVINLSWSLITQDVLDNGAVDAYVRFTGQTTWHPIPLTFYQDANYSTTIEVAYGLNAANLFWSDSDLTTPITPSNVDVKLLIQN